MGRALGQRWSWLLSAAVLLFGARAEDVSTSSDSVTVSTDKVSSSYASCENQQSDRFLLIVSTLDGKVSALNVADNGQLMWSVDTGARPLVSASISTLQMKKNGVATRLIPSLDGALYQMDDDGIEPLPLDADSLLSSSFRFGDDGTIVGAKESETYGLDAETGKLKYICSTEGCQKFEEHGVVASEYSILAIRRHTKTIRAVALSLGEEKWNFSVSHHDVAYVSATEDTGSASQDSSIPDEPICDEDNPTIQVDAADGDESLFGSLWNEARRQDVEFKVIVPFGVIFAVSKSNPTQVIWQHKFETAIANAWTLNRGHLSPLDLFDGRHVPALAYDGSTGGAPSDDLPASPLLYIGRYDNQLYVQPSVIMLEHMQHAAAESIKLGSPMPLTFLPKVKWKPYLASAPSRTPALPSHLVAPRVTWEQSDDRHGNEDVDYSDTAVNTDVSIWHEEYPYDSGFYLFLDYTPFSLEAQRLKQVDNTSNHKTVPKEDTRGSLWNWWKEVAAFSLLTSVLVHVFIAKLMKLKTTHTTSSNSQPTSSEHQCTNRVNGGSEKEQLAADVEKIEGEKPNDFVSRYYTDFEQLACLGKGGFGVVFEARNRMDDCSYAIKRIPLNNSDRAKDRVMREVKALAKLEHPGIVRYHQSWFESPPPGWQERRDRVCVDMSSPSGTTDVSLTGCQRAPLEQQRPYCASNSNSIENIARGTHRLQVPFDGGRLAGDDTSTCGVEFADSGGAPSIAAGRTRDRSSSSSFDIVFRDSGCQGENESEIDSDDESSDSKRRPLEGNPAGGDCAVVDMPSSDQPSVTKPSPALRPTDLRISQPRLFLYIQMQLCKRESLRDWLQENTLNRPRQTVLDIFHQITSAVNYVHNSGLMHRDLKPSNIFFSKDGAVKVGDFGLVTAVEEQLDSSGGDTWQTTGKTGRHTNQVGTQLYMSPEQMAGRNYTHKVDIFALGMIFFELFYPFATQMERMQQMMTVRKGCFPERFQRELPNECDLLQPLLSATPEVRPSALNVLEHPLLCEFEAARVAVHRLRSTSRTRTASSSSGNSSSLT